MSVVSFWGLFWLVSLLDRDGDDIDGYFSIWIFFQMDINDFFDHDPPLVAFPCNGHLVDGHFQNGVEIASVRRGDNKNGSNLDDLID